MLTLILFGMLIPMSQIQPVEPIEAESRTWIVDDDGQADFSRIQDAINAASSGDTIFVHDGTYYEHLTIGKSISLVGENRATSIIDGSRTGTVISVFADFVNISRLTIRNGYQIPHITYGIQIGKWEHGCQNVTVYDNILSANDIGIFVYYSNNITILNNLLSSNFIGIQTTLSSDNRIERNNLVNNEEGIGVGSGANNNVIIDNDISICGFGIHVGWSMGNVIAGNTISLSTSAGIRFDASNNNSIIGNTITLSSREGIVLFGSDNNAVMENEVAQNGWDGIAVWYSEGNQIYHNNFRINTRQAGSYAESTNAWDNGFPSGGNYWSDYTMRYPSAQELDDSGIWDTPYVLDGNNQDNYSLMEPWTPLEPIPASIDIDTDILNPRRKGKWITVYIQLPEGYNPSDIHASTILLNGTVPPVLDPRYGFVTNSTEYLVDHNNDIILERMVKFDRATLESWIYQNIGMQNEISLTVTGELTDGTLFDGTDTIYVLWQGHKSPSKL